MSDDRAEEIKKNILSPSQWIRILYMAFYAVACWVVLFVLPVIIVCQIIISLISGADNKNLREFGAALSAYVHQAINYLVYATNDRAWPFSDGEDLGDIVDDDFEDDSDDDKDDKDDSPASNAAPEASASGGDDVFSDISFTDNADEADVDSDDADDADDRKDDSNEKDKS